MPILCKVSRTGQFPQTLPITTVTRSTRFTRQQVASMRPSNPSCLQMQNFRLQNRVVRPCPRPRRTLCNRLHLERQRLRRTSSSPVSSNEPLFTGPERLKLLQAATCSFGSVNRDITLYCCYNLSEDVDPLNHAPACMCVVGSLRTQHEDTIPGQQ